MGAAAREWDLVVYGATGFTGRLAARYLADPRSPGAGRARVALAGRSRERVEAVRAELRAQGWPAADAMGVLEADSGDAEALADIAGRTRALLTFAGPYRKYGFPVAKACVEAGCHYFDISGESAFQRSLVDSFHGAACSRGVCMVTACGYDSVPFDIGTLMCVRALREQEQARCTSVEAVLGSAKGGFSGGTLASGIHAMATGDMKKFGDPHVLDPGYERTAKVSAPKAVRYLSFLGRWLAPSVMESINQKVVYRTRGLLSREYGDIQYRESTAVPSRLTGHLMRLGLGVLGLMMKFSSIFLALGVLPKPSEGPSEELRESGYFNVQVVGEGETAAGERRFALAHVGCEPGTGDPGYKLTAAMASECALCVLEDLKALPGKDGGVLTPASCFGERLVPRLKNAGIDCSVRVGASPDAVGGFSAA